LSQDIKREVAHGIFIYAFDTMQRTQGERGGHAVQLEADQKRCLDCLVWATQQLNSQVDPSQLDKTAELIIQTMTGPWRYFHTPEHIFEVGGSQDAVEILAALFHDLVYVQVDQGVNLNIGSYIVPFIKEVKGQLVIQEAAELPEEPMFELVMAIFGFVPSQALSPFAGQNEFLSAVICAKSLEPFVPPRAIAEIVACIEATIPFRPKLSSGLTVNDLLYQRLIDANRHFRFGWTDEEIIQVMKRSVRLANRDVENFASPNSAHFLDNTWNLLPETNHELMINANSYTVRGYRTSLQKMEGFMNFLKPDLVFQQFMGEPDDQTYQDLVARTRKNMEVAKLYLGSKLIAIGILEALSYRLGQNIPISTMLGELPSKQQKVVGLEHLLPNIANSYHPESELEVEVLELLSKGRSQESSYDLKNSPLSTFIIQSVGFKEIQHLLKRAKEFFQGAIDAEEFLADCKPDVISAITEGVSQLFDNRKAALRG